MKNSVSNKHFNFTNKLPKPTHKISDLLPDTWLNNTLFDRVWMRAYRIATFSKEDVQKNTIVDFDSIRALTVYGSIPYANGPTLEFDDTSNKIIAKGQLEIIQSKEAAWLLLFTPLDKAENEIDIKFRLSAITGIISLIVGRNSVYEKLFDQIINVKTEQFSFSSNIVENPGVFPKPNLSHDNLNSLVRTVRAYENIEDKFRNRVELSLHWIELSLRDDGIDAFLKSWIALETLAMPEGTKIKPINQLLATAYNLEYEDAAEQFLVRKIYKARSDLVHNGKKIITHHIIQEYLHAIYLDVLNQTLSVEAEHRAGTFLDIHRKDLIELLSQK